MVTIIKSTLITSVSQQSILKLQGISLPDQKSCFRHRFDSSFEQSRKRRDLSYDNIIINNLTPLPCIPITKMLIKIQYSHKISINRPSSLFLLTISLLLLPSMCFNKIQLEERNEKVVKRSQMISFNQMEISNFYNYQYYAKIELGTPPQKAEVILDTGSHHFWVPSKNCSNCPLTFSKFDHKKSSTAKVLNSRQNLKYGKGEIKGFYVQDILKFENSSANFKFVLADYQKDLQNSQADGIMGLSNWPKVKNIFEVLASNGVLSSSKVGFQLGLKELKEKSYFFYNISEEDFPEAQYLNASKKDYWTIPIREIKVENKSYSIKNALVDSGTSLIIMPPSLYLQLDSAVFSSLCEPYKINTMRKCKCPSSAQYPNITLFSGHLSFNITPDSYILGSYNNKQCILGIDMLVDSNIDFVILGDLFFHHQTIIFDKENNRIGFINNYRTVNLFPSHNFIITIFNSFAVFALIVALFILGMRKRTHQSGLNEPLRIGASVELATN